MISTRLTELLGVTHPVVCGGMTGLGTAPLVSAVANAGALGFLTALTQPTPDDLSAEIQRTKDLTDQPFGVNLTILPTINPVPYDEYRAAIVESGVKIVETAGSDPSPHLPDLQVVMAEGDTEGGMWWAGQSQGLIDDIDTCQNVIDRIITEAEDIIVRRLSSLVTGTDG